MDLSGAMNATNVAVALAALPDKRLFKKLKQELIKDKARDRAVKKAAVRRMRRIISSLLPETSPDHVMEDAPPPGTEEPLPFQPSLPPQTETTTPAPAPSPAPAAAVAPATSHATAQELERKIARLEAELSSRDRSRQKRNDAFRSLKASEHEKMLDLMDARHHIEGLVAKIARLEEELEESKKETVSWIQRAEQFKGERYQAFAHTIDPVPPPTPRAVEWGILAKQSEFWAGVVGVMSLLVAVYVAGKYLGDNAPAIPLPCPRQIPCPRPPRVESPKAPSCPKVECPRVECPRVTESRTGPDLPPGKNRGDGSLIAAYGVGALMGGVGTWYTVKAMD